MKYLWSLLVSLIFCTTISYAQSGLFVAPNSSAITSPITGSTWLFNSTNKTVNVWTGSSYLAVNAPFSNYEATNAPTSHNDSTQGYVVGSFWLNQTSQVLYICADNTSSAALWLGVSAVTSSVPLANIAQGGATNGQSLIWNNTSGVWNPASPAILLSQLLQSGATSGQVPAWSGSAWVPSNNGSGTVTTFSSGNLSPLFTSSVATATSTPALTFALSTAAAHTIFSNTSGSSALPAFNALTLSATSPLAITNSGNLANSPTISITSPLPIANGGTGASSTTAHTYFGNPLGITATPGFNSIVNADLPNTVVTSVNNTSTLINASISSQVLNLSDNGTLAVALSQITQSGATTGQTIHWSGSAWVPTTAGSGTVTSVALTGDGTIFNSTVTGSPVTTSGTLVPVLLTQSANTVLAGPTSGSAAAPVFRSLIATDLPSAIVANTTNLTPLFNSSISGQTLTFTAPTVTSHAILSNITSGAAIFASNVLTLTATSPLTGGGDLATSPTIGLGTVGPANGGTGITSTPTNGQLPIGNGTNFTLSGITAGINVSVSNGSGSITVSSSFLKVNHNQNNNFTANAQAQYFVDLTSNNVAMTLPDATTCGGADIRVFVSIIGATHSVTFATTGGQLINGVSAGSLTALSTLGNTYTFTSDGSNWWISCAN